jgi:ElaB/YqjD/DUF883 family membrane-anchored ribosome-binding protein
METQSPNDVGGSRHARNALDDLGAQIGPQIDELRERIDEYSDRAAHFIRTRPGTSLLIAVGAGYLIGRLLR